MITRAGWIDRAGRTGRHGEPLPLLKNRAAFSPLSYNQDLGQCRPLLGDGPIALDIFDTNDGCGYLRQNLTSLKPITTGDNTLLIPLAHPTLRRCNQQRLLENRRDRGRHFLVQWTQVNNRRLAIGRWNIFGLNGSSNRANGLPAVT